MESKEKQTVTLGQQIARIVYSNQPGQVKIFCLMKLLEYYNSSIAENRQK